MSDPLAAAGRVEEFLAARQAQADAPKTTTDPELIYSIGTNGNETGRVDLNVSDLRAVLNELARHRAAADALRKVGIAGGEGGTDRFDRGWNACRARVHGLIAHYIDEEA